MAPTKRELESSDNEASGSSSTSTPEKKPRAAKSKYSTAEEKRFIDAWYEVGKEQLWQKLKNDPELRKRGANGIRSHLDAMVKKLQKEV